MLVGLLSAAALPVVEKLRWLYLQDFSRHSEAFYLDALAFVVTMRRDSW